MKIYANTRNYDIEYLIGKDLWVRVFNVWIKKFEYLKLDSVSGAFVFVGRIDARIVDMINKEKFTFNDISLVQGLKNNPLISISTSYRLDDIKNYFIIPKPLDTLSDEEMQEILAEVKRRVLE